MSIRGIFTAMVTPFDERGGLDTAIWRKLVRAQVEAGVAGVVPCGTTGENPALSDDERRQMILIALEETEGTNTRVYAGTGTNHTHGTVIFSKWAAKAGVAGVLVVTPYYSKPSQAGLRAHFQAVADEISCPLILYNVPGRTGVSLQAETIADLARHPRIVALKEATGDTAFTSEIRDTLAQAGQHLDILSGDDATFLPLLSVGAVGAVSVASNVIPAAMVQMQGAFEQGNASQALEMHRKYYPLFRDLFVESNPVPVKYALAEMGLCSPKVRLPLAALTKESKGVVDTCLKRCGLVTS